MCSSDLAATVLKALAERNSLNTADVDDIIWGTSTQVAAQGADLGRMAALDAGYDIRASGMTLDRFCGSGITTVSLAAAQIMSGMEDLVIAGGTEMMSYVASIADPKQPPMLDRGNLHLRSIHPQSQQGVCADFIATLEGIDRKAVDELALASQQRAAAAVKDGRFLRSLVPVYNLDGSLALDHDEFPRPETTLETLAGLKPRARVVATANIGDCPTLMLNAPVPAARKVLAKAGLSVNDIDLFEINEAFAVVAEKFIRDLKLDRATVNVNGGAIALGHPIGATGAMLVGTLFDELERQGT